MLSHPLEKVYRLLVDWLCWVLLLVDWLLGVLLLRIHLLTIYIDLNLYTRLLVS